MSRFQLAVHFQKIVPFRELQAKYLNEMAKRKILNLPTMTMVEWCESKDALAARVQAKRKAEQQRQYAGYHLMMSCGNHDFGDVK